MQPAHQLALAFGAAQAGIGAEVEIGGEKGFFVHNNAHLKIGQNYWDFSALPYLYTRFKPNLSFITQAFYEQNNIFPNRADAPGAGFHRCL